MYFDEPCPTVRFDGAAIESTAVKQTLDHKNKKARYQNTISGRIPKEPA